MYFSMGKWGKPNRKKNSSYNKWWDWAKYYTAKPICHIGQLFSYILFIYRYVAGRVTFVLRGEAVIRIRKENKKLTAMNDSLKEELEHLIATIDPFKKKVAELTDKNNSLKKDFTTTNNSSKKKIAKLISTNSRHLDDIGILKNNVATKEKEINNSKNNIEILKKELVEKNCKNERLQDKISTLTEEKRALQAEKQDALRRLSEAVSAKLGDNNLNIVDLNDQCRLTKLADMFGELYDNEWTTAYAVLSLSFTEEQTISILLDIVMDAYKFCEERVEEIWEILTEWFLDENHPGTKETMKRLKDGRKTNIHKQFSKLGLDFNRKLTQLCDEDSLKELLPDVSLNAYLMKCIELCLLMVATDPPVVLVCPGWRTRRLLQFDDTVVNRTDTNEESKTEYESTHQSVTQEVDDTCGSGNVERPRFDKQLFNVYKSRGKYLDYIVWPTMYLYRNGPLLSKGIAQGTQIQYKEVNSYSEHR